MDIRSAAALVFAIAATANSAAAERPGLADYAQSFLAALTEDQRDAAAWPFGHRERQISASPP